MKLDALICPGYPHAAFNHQDAEELSVQCHFLSLYNILDYPAGVVPVTQVLSGEDDPKIFNDNYNDRITAKLRNSIRGSMGLPIGL